MCPVRLFGIHTAVLLYMMRDVVRGRRVCCLLLLLWCFVLFCFLLLLVCVLLMCVDDALDSSNEESRL